MMVKGDGQGWPIKGDDQGWGSRVTVKGDGQLAWGSWVAVKVLTVLIQWQTTCTHVRWVTISILLSHARLLVLMSHARPPVLSTIPDCLYSCHVRYWLYKFMSHVRPSVFLSHARLPVIHMRVLMSHERLLALMSICGNFCRLKNLDSLFYFLCRLCCS